MAIPYSTAKKAIQSTGIRSSKEATELFVMKMEEKMAAYAKQLADSVLSGKGKTADTEDVEKIFQ